MTKGAILRLILTLGGFVLILMLNANLRPVSAQTCDTVTDQQMVKDIYARVNANRSLATQISHFNVTVLYQVVKLQGWTDTQKDFDKLVEIASATACARIINKNLLLPTPPAQGDALRSSGGCASGTKACGDICIPEGDACNTTTAKP